MKTAEPKAAEWISEAIGKVEIERLKETKFDGSRSGKNFTVDRQIEPLVMGSEIGGLDDRHAYLKLGNHVFRSKIRLTHCGRRRRRPRARGPPSCCHDRS